MAEKKYNDERIYDRLMEVGYVDNFWAIDNRITTRLGAVIYVLRHRDGMDLMPVSGKKLGKPRAEWKNTYYMRPEVYEALTKKYE